MARRDRNRLTGRRGLLLDRRGFLRAALLATGAFAASPLGRARAQALAGRRVIVVGAGLAGLAAAKALRNQGAEVVVLESKPHIGGRLLTDWSLGPPFEVGAGWIHGPSPDNPAKQLADAVGAQYVVTDNDNLVVYDAGGALLGNARMAEIDGTWASILDGIDEELSSSDPRSLRDAAMALYPDAMRDPGVIWALSAYTEFSKGGPIENLSAAYQNKDVAFPGDDVVVTTGYDKLLAPIAAGLDIRLSTRVTGIAYGSDGVEVKTAAGTEEGDFVVCSVPLGVLKKGAIAFDPPLPAEYQANIRQIGFGSVTKCAFKFKEAFWDTSVQYFGIQTAEKGRWNYWLSYRTFTEENILLGLSVGAYAPRADEMSDEQMKADALDALRSVWGADVSEPVQMLRTNWWTDPDTLGAYAFITPGCKPNQFDDLAEPVEDRVFLCGEHTIFESAGTTQGAYMSGLRAAELVIDSA